MGVFTLGASQDWLSVARPFEGMRMFEEIGDGLGEIGGYRFTAKARRSRRDAKGFWVERNEVTGRKRRRI